MYFSTNQATLGVSPSSPLTVNDAHGLTLRVVEGRIWITQEGSLDDVFLVAGATYAFEGSGAAVLSAENPDKSASVVAFDTPLSVRASETIDRNWFTQLKQSWIASAAV